MLNKSTSRSKYVVQSGVTQYPVGFEFFFNGDDTPQVAVSIGAEVPTLNRHYKFSDDLSTLILIPTEEEAADITGPEDFRWMDKWVGMELVIERDIPFVQESDYQLGRISPERIEKDFDLSVMRDQMLAGQIQEHTDDVQGEIDALNSRIDFVQEEHVLDMAAVDEVMATKAAKADVDAEFVTVNADLATKAAKADVDTEFATVNADLATKATKTELVNAKTVLEEGIQGNADAILKTRNDYEAADQKIRADMNSKDSELETITNDHAARLRTLRTDVDDLGDQVSGIESKIPESASETNPLVTKGDLADIDLDDYVKKSGDTMTGDLRLVSNAELSFENRYGTMVIQQSPTGTGWQIINMHPNTNVAASALQATSTTLRFNPIVDTPGLVRLLGDTDYPWDNVYAKKLNNGADLIIPAEGGTLARVEDLIDLRADINEADSELQTQITAQAAEIATKAEKDSVYTKEQVDAKVSSVYKVKGSVANYDSLPTGANVGDVYNVLDTGVNYVWTADGWDALGGAVDLTDYAKKDDLSDYLPLSGGTLTGPLEINYGQQADSYASVTLLSLTTKKYNGYSSTLSFGYNPYLSQLVATGVDALYGFKEILPFPISSTTTTIGSSALPWTKVYTTKLNSGGTSDRDLIVPTEGGTLARLEDVANTAGEIVGQAKEYVDEAIATTVNDIAAVKQDKLTAGEGITIEDNVISATGGGGASLPDQTGNAGKFLTTDGTTASWGNGLKIDSTNIVIGDGAQGDIVNSMAIGRSAKATTNAMAIGRNAKASPLGGTAQAMAIGPEAQSTGTRSIAIGCGAIATGNYSIQLGNVWQGTVTNADPNTFKVANNNGNFEMMDANGNVPLGRLTYVTDQIGDISTALTAILGE